jgi:hypothetical protein
VRASRLRPCIATSARRSDRVASEGGGRCAKRGRGEEAPGRAALSNTRRECQPAGAKHPCDACWRAPYSRMRRLPLAAAGREGRLVCRSQAPPAGGRLYREKEPRSPPAVGRRGILCATGTGGALQRERTSCSACWRAPRDLMRRQNWRAPYREKNLARRQRPGRARACLRDLRCHERTRQGTVGPSLQLCLYETRVVNS